MFDLDIQKFYWEGVCVFLIHGSSMCLLYFFLTRRGPMGKGRN